MIHLVLVSHSDLAESCKRAVKMIAGTVQAERISTVCMTEQMSPEEFIARADAVRAEAPDGSFLIMADLYGASPCSSSLMAFRGADYRVVTGMNLGMVLETLASIDSTPSLAELAGVAEGAGKEGVKTVYIPDC